MNNKKIVQIFGVVVSFTLSSSCTVDKGRLNFLISTPTPKPTEAVIVGSNHVSNIDGMNILFVPAGEFLMGSEYGFRSNDSGEQPQRLVFISDFWIDETEITNSMYANFLNENGNKMEGDGVWFNNTLQETWISENNKKWEVSKGFENYPVGYVSWYGAKAYCEWAGRRLPTEAEWEKAARGTDGRIYPWGNQEPSDEVLYMVNELDPNSLQRVGAYPKGASPYGALDMLGNVKEWTADWFEAEYYDLNINNDPLGPDSGNMRVVRGDIPPGLTYIAFRGLRTDPNFVNFYSGFRCAYSEKEFFYK